METESVASSIPFNIFEPRCPSREVFDQIFSRWGILVLARLSREGIRFGSLRRSIGGISEKMLSRTLKVLESEGLVQRREWNGKPLRVEYNLTESGQNISKSVSSLIKTLYAELEKQTKDYG